MDEWDGSSLLVIVNNHIIYRAALRVLACLGDGRCLSVSGNHTFARHGDFAIFLPHDICLPVIHSLQRDCIRNRRSLAGIILASNLAATSAWILFPCPSTKSIVALIPSSHCSNLFIALLGTGPGVYVDLKTFKFPRSDHRIVGWRLFGHDVVLLFSKVGRVSYCLIAISRRVQENFVGLKSRFVRASRCSRKVDDPAGYIEVGQDFCAAVNALR